MVRSLEQSGSYDTLAAYRKVRDGIKLATCETSFEKYLDAFQNTLWENGVRRPTSKPRTDAEKSRAKMNAGRKIQAFIPGE